MPLSSRVEPGSYETNVGAIVAPSITNATLCLLQASTSTPNIQLADASMQSILDAAALKSACSPASADARAAWRLQLQPGQNDFNITGTALLDVGSNLAESTGANLTLSVIRLADQTHATLRRLIVKGLDGTSVVACGPPTLQAGSIVASTVLPVAVTDAGPPSPPSAETIAMGPPPAQSVPAASTLEAWKDCSPGEHRSLHGNFIIWQIWIIYMLRCHWLASVCRRRHVCCPAVFN